MLRISQQVLDLIIAHSQKGLPHEVCGYLTEKDGRIIAHYELTNIDAAFDHFRMRPEEQFAAVKDLRQKGLTLKVAYDPEISYVIISLVETEPAVKSFRIQKGEVTA